MYKQVWWIQRRERDEWWEHKRSLTVEEVLDEELIVCELGTLDSFQSPFDALQAILNFHGCVLRENNS